MQRDRGLLKEVDELALGDDALVAEAISGHRRIGSSHINHIARQHH
jgi:hypothetical protein